VILFVGRLAHQKGVDVLLEAFRSVREAEPGCRLVLVGDGPMRAQLEEYTRAAGLQDDVHFAGVVEDPAIFTRAADLFAIPSRYEGLPNSLLEAMSCGLPSVATRVSGSEDIIRHGENGLLVEPEDAEGLAAAITALASDPVQAADMGVRARETVLQDFSIDSVARRCIELYHEVTGG
jgi:glycosyltransferase involved in cell wall biosynthesis